jgi:hypothetical protein
MHKLSTMWAYEKLLPFTSVALSAPVIIWPTIATARTGRVLSYVFSVMGTSQLQKMYSLQGPAKENLPPSSNQTVSSSRPHPANHLHSARSIICTNHLSVSSYYTNPCACPTCQPTPTGIQRHLGLQSPVEKPLRSNGNLAKPPHHSHYQAQIMAPFLPPTHTVKHEQLAAFYNTLGRRFIAGGDYNAKHTDWGSRLISPRGREVLKAMERVNLHWRTHLLACRLQQTPWSTGLLCHQRLSPRLRLD